MAARKYKRWMLAVKDGVHPLGSTGSLVTEYVSHKYLVMQAERFKHMYGHDEVYLVSQYTQEMCEMDMTQFVAHVKKNGVKLA